MIYMILHRPSLKNNVEGFSIVDGKINILKGVGQFVNHRANLVQHGSNPIPLVIDKIIYQEGSYVSTRDFKKWMQINK